MRYHFKIHKENKGYWAECLELTGCLTQAKNLKDLHANMQEALNLYVEEPEDSKEIIPLPDSKIRKTKTIVEIPLDSQVGFAMLMRHFRINSGLTQKQVAKKVGFDSVYSYQRLEGRRCNPSLKTLTRIKRVFPKFSIDMAMGF